MSRVAGLRGRVTFVVLATAAVLFSALGTIGFVQIANDGRAAIKERVESVLDRLEAAVFAETGTLQLSTADGVFASVSRTPVDGGNRPGEIRVVRQVGINGQTVFLVGTASQARLSENLTSLHRNLWMAIPIASIVSALFAGYATGRALKPVHDIAAMLQGIGHEPKGRRVPVVRTADEIEHLAETVNALLDRIDGGWEVQRRFTADAAHELRTPTMALRAEIDLLPESLDRARLDKIVRRLSAQIDDLLLLASLDEPRSVTRTSVELRELATDEAAIVSAVATVSGDIAVVTGDRPLLGRAIRNLVANAQRHTNVRIDVNVERDGDKVWVHVDDDGSGISFERRGEIFNRFTRLDEARSADQGGSGLGLAIVAGVAAVHGGSARASANPWGGARVSFWVPAATDARNGQ